MRINGSMPALFFHRPYRAFLILAGCLCLLQATGQKDSIIALSPPRVNHLLVLPVVARSIETSWSFGSAVAGTFHVSRNDSTIRTSNLQGLVLYSLKKQFVAAINGTIYFPHEKFILTQQVSYSYFPDKFWGIGPMTPDSNAESYNFEQFYVYLHGQRALSPHLYIGAIYEYQRLFAVSYRKDGLFEKEQVPGRSKYQVSGLGASLTYDTRNDAFAPDKGIFLQGSFNHFSHILGADFEYTNFVLDARSFIPTFKKQVLALQAYAFMNAGTVPLRSLASFGGSSSMRGYYNGRYRDKNQVVFQAEYRVPVYRRFGAAVFGGVGNVSHDCRFVPRSDIKYAYGAGFRIRLSKSEKLNLRLDYGIAEGGKSKGFYFQLGEAF